MRPNALKKKLARGGKALGCWLFINHPVVAEIIGMSGFDCVMIDHEHGPGHFESAITLMQAVRAAGDTTCLMRVPVNDPVYIKRALDIGVEGVMVPMVDTPEQAQAVVAACRYPPAGLRGGASPLVRAADYGLHEAAYLDSIDDNLLIICQIETQLGIDNAEAIAAVDGVDMLFIGPMDLAASLGYTRDRGNSKLGEVLSRLKERIQEAGGTVGTIPREGTNVGALFTAGYDLVMGTSDIGLLRDGAREQVGARAVREGRRN